ncbi:MAG: hypothetical protein U9Q15_00640 [Patescibacteria group bacterium]|nr:hypothetical protein [Patescibacteria group bacterium]
MVIKLLFQEYLEHHYFIGSTPATIQWHKRCMNVFFREFPDIIDVDEISPELAQRYVYQLHKRGNKPVTIATTLR